LFVSFKSFALIDFARNCRLMWPQLWLWCDCRGQK